MKVISLHVPEAPYQKAKSLARQRGVSVAQLLREAMLEYLEREGHSGVSVLDIPPFDGGRLKKSWTRSELLDEMIER
jgi:hypothetical protein